MYFQWANGSFTEVQAIMSQYYLTSPNISFPDDIRILAGNPFATAPSSDPQLNAAMDYRCLDATNTTISKYWPMRTCSVGLQARLFLPRCWDGVNLDSPTHTTHISYPSGVGVYNSQCPDTHPFMMPMVLLENLYFIDVFKVRETEALD